MPFGKDDVQFTFDSTSFVNTIKEMAGQMSEMTDNVKENVEKMSVAFEKFYTERDSQKDQDKKDVSKINKGVVGGLLKFSVLKTAVIGLFKAISGAVNQYIPEVSQTFGIAKGIILKNLLWPLRKALLPALQNVLSWVRENRGMFARWGMVLVNSAKLVKVSFEALMRFISPIIKAITKTISSIFGTTTKRTDEMINIIIFKLTNFMILIEKVFGPIFDSVGDLLQKTLGNITNIIKKFTGSFSKAFGKVDLGGLSLLKYLIVGIGKALEIAIIPLEKFAQIVGTLYGSFFGQIKTEASALNEMLAFQKKWKDAGALKGGKFIGTPEQFSQYVYEKTALKESMRNMREEFRQGALGAFKDIFTNQEYGGEKVNDAIITKKGDVVKLNPNDNIYASKGTPGGVSIMLNFSGAQFSVSEGNARSAGENFADGLGSKLREILTKDLVLSGTHA